MPWSSWDLLEFFGTRDEGAASVYCLFIQYVRLAVCMAVRLPTGRPKDWRDLRFEDGGSLPIALRNRRVNWIKWGRVRGDPGARLWPPGGWVDHTVIKSGKWWRLNPRPVVIPVMGYQMRTNWKGWKDDQWYYPMDSQAIQGALVTREGEQRVYMVVQPNEEYGTKIWPRLIGYLSHLVVWTDIAGELLPDEMD